MKHRVRFFTVAAIVGVAGGIAATYLAGSNPIMVGSAMLNIIRSSGEPAPSITVELRQAAQASTGAAPISAPATGNQGDWSAFNRTISGERYSPLDQINTKTAQKLRVVCTYDTEKLEGNQTGLLMVNGAIIGTTAEDIFSIDASTCKENWRTHEDSGLGRFPVNRGATYMDGKLFRGYVDGYVRAYDATTGKKLWETYLNDKALGLWFNSAPQAWNGMVFYGTAGADTHNIRGRVYALDAETGKPIWQTFMVPPTPTDPVYAKLGTMPEAQMRATWGNPPDVPITGGGLWTTYSIDPETGYLYLPVGNPAPDFVKSPRPGTNQMTNTLLALDSRTGDYVKHYQIMPDDWHDWDMSNAPTLYTSRAGHKQASFSPKDGHLYSYDLNTDEQRYRQPVTKMLNTDVPFEPGKDVYFCPGSVGGGEWNSTAFDPQYNLLFTGQNEWCTTATIEEDSKVARAKDGAHWFGTPYLSPLNVAGVQDPISKWGGWFYASDADTGEWQWRARTNYPILGAVTPTAGGIVMFGDVSGAFYVLDASNGEELWHHEFNDGIAGGVITYSADGEQRIALSTGMAHPVWPVPPGTAKVTVLGL